ncbi:MAG: T9SS type A sorting domain-containing protein [Flavisolibacter sp.]
MRTILLGICILFASTIVAQRECASSAYTEQQKSIDPTFSNRMNAIEDFIQNRSLFTTGTARMNGTEGSAIIRIPVVVHVIYKSADQNITDAQVKSQIDALNRDFRRKNADTVNTPERFKSLAADIHIEFVLASADPMGRATTGIVRKQTTISEWKMDDNIKFTKNGGDDAWDSRYYLNFWVGNMRSLLGYSSLPGSTADRDGIVINTTAFGTVNMTGAYNMGRTAVHEVGHWLGLMHIWGDTYCGDDLVSDTPKQGNFTAGCPSGFRSSCNNGTAGDMYMNYMDFTSDACMNLFTAGQKDRMLALFSSGGPRNLILSSKALNEPWAADAPVVETPSSNLQFKFYPNPVAGEMVLNFDHNTSWIGKTISVINMNGTVLTRIQIGSKTQRIQLSSLKPGMYFIQGENQGEKIREKFIKL